ncbi:MAG: peptidoglycan DD-metalloendopeptidase family protein [Lautropia sp.]
MQTSTGRRLASALAAALSVATITAFAVAPLTQEPIPARLRIIEPVALKPARFDAEGTFHRQAVIQRGETLGSLLNRLGDQDGELFDFIRTDKTARRLLMLQSGLTVRAEVDGNDRISHLSYPMPDGFGEDDSPARLEIVRTPDGTWQARVDRMMLDRVIETRHAVIKTSLFAATDAAGIPDAIAMRIPDVFGSDLDFHRDVRKGDTLRIVYEMLHDPDSNADGKAGRILAVEYASRRQKLEAVWFERADGEGEYYTFAGKRLKSSFLRSPMEFTRISSGFSVGRRHPVFRDWRAHRGVDYAAPINTKVRSIGDGVVEFAGVQRGYGRVVIIRHDARHQTLYAHLNRFAPGLSTGDKVEKGDVIGGVGRTGWATGPHLHFEFHVRGQQVDPTQVIPPPPAPLDAGEQRRFERYVAAYVRRLDEGAPAQLATFE